MSGMMKAALDLAAARWRVIPLNGKVPVITDWPTRATTDPDVIRAWWADEDWNIGARIPDNHVVIDIDPQNGGSIRALERLAGVALPPTMTIKSGRGGGSVHLHYLRPFPRTSKLRMPAGVDVLTNAQVVMPPSIHPDTGKPYRWGPDVPVARLPAEVISLIEPRTPSTHRGGTASVGALVSTLRDAGPGEKHNTLVWAAFRAHEAGVGQRGLDKLIDAAEDIGMDPREARRVVESAGKDTRP